MTTAVADQYSFSLLYHAVVKEIAMKLRVVFDSPARSSTGISINDAWIVGPAFQSNLTSMLIRFRKQRFVLSTDIEKIRVHEDHHKFQRIL